MFHCGKALNILLVFTQDLQSPHDLCLFHCGKALNTSKCMQAELEELDMQLQAAHREQQLHAAALEKLDVAKCALQYAEQEASSSAGHKAQQQADELEAQLKVQEEQHTAALQRAKEAETTAKVRTILCHPLESVKCKALLSARICASF
jgi:galactitol-specific phosphotransferase system IIB component